MNAEQRKAVIIVQAGVNRLTDALVDEFDIREEDALEIVRELDGLTGKLQAGEIGELHERAMNKARKVIGSAHNPKEYYPGHPQHRPMYTTKSTFNAHVAQATAPYVIAIAKHIAKDRGLDTPSDAEIKRALGQLDWAKAAYEAEKMPNRPPPGRINQWFMKFVFKPLDKILEFPFENAFFLFSTVSAMMMLWTAFSGSLAKYGQPVVDAVIYGVEKLSGYR